MLVIHRRLVLLFPPFILSLTLLQKSKEPGQRVRILILAPLGCRLQEGLQIGAIPANHEKSLAAATTTTTIYQHPPPTISSPSFLCFYADDNHLFLQRTLLSSSPSSSCTNSLQPSILIPFGASVSQLRRRQIHYAFKVSPVPFGTT